VSSPVKDSGRLIYAGYPTVTDAPLAVSSTSISFHSLLSSTFTSIPVGGIGFTSQPSSSIAGQNIATSPVSAIVSPPLVSSSIIPRVTSSTIALLSLSTSNLGGQSLSAVSPTTITNSLSPLSSVASSGTCGTTLPTSVAPIPTDALCPGTPGGTVYGVSFSGSGTGSATPYEIGKIPRPPWKAFFSTDYFS